MKLWIKDRVVVITPNTDAVMLIISDSLIKKLELPILSINPIKVQALNIIITIIEVINEPLLKIQ